MPLNAEAVLAKATAGRGLWVSFGADARRIISQPEYAIYLRGLKGPPLWVVKILYAADYSYLQPLVSDLRLNLELAFAIQDVNKRPVNYNGLAVAVLEHYTTRGLCHACNGTGRNDAMRQCAKCQGLCFVAWRDQTMYTAAGITRSSYSRRRAVYNNIVERQLWYLEECRIHALAHIQDNLR